ncbi:MAG TPA: flagellar basal body rod protein FlgC [Chromatiaceae bacterium]|nr:flagellar basal body rod protein FlgC [Chromatiaceae bacterium]HIB84484.1 flagellar basal body rod protein FlgC [Chromatiaceae bacterium]HIN82706.1 flagellar basal body rod protein FlgC [Chromatiales bacterium]HIO14668.1 flagellar basal body rod protein FlgC [Chromatiales bacterium]HIO53766.1 flagellar basal body rod protein FlgC [Chromatiales bacterium]
MPLMNIFNVAGTGMSAQTVRLNTIASNMANADSVSSSVETTYRSRQPVFKTMLEGMQNNQASTGVEVIGIVESSEPLRQRYMPDHPMANDEGFVFFSNVNPVQEMANMMAASRAYRNNVEVLNTSRQLLLNTLRIGQ